MKKVVIVEEGEWGQMSTARGDYDQWIETIKGWVGSAERCIGFSDKKEKAATCEVVETAKEAWKRAGRREVDVVVFKSRSMLSKARMLQETFPHVRVVLFTALWPEGEVVIVDRKWALTPKTAQEMILG